MLTYAIGFIQTMQLLCFALVFLLMALQDRDNRTIRWTAFAYLAGLIGVLLQLGQHLLPRWASHGLVMEAAPIAYACIHVGIIHFVRRGERTRWISAALIAVGLPFYLLWSSHPAQMVYSCILSNLILGLQASLTAWLLLSTRDPETLWPRSALATFASLYAAVEYARVAVLLTTGKPASFVTPWIAVASGMVYIVSVMPLAIVWMTNTRLHAHLERESTSDPLTGVLNRRGIEVAAQHELARYARAHQEFSVIVFDIDYFKHFNDTFGHAGGDLVLRDTSTLFKSLLRDTDSLGRLGGEEFVLLLPDTPLCGAERLVERLRLTLQAQTFQLPGRAARITSSFGITSSFDRADLTWDTLLNEADQALYAAKRAGRNRAELHSLRSPSLHPAFEAVHEMQGA
jgi:diguanylate cyclase (GGDEF)-like protein